MPPFRQVGHQVVIGCLGEILRQRAHYFGARDFPQCLTQIVQGVVRSNQNQPIEFADVDGNLVCDFNHKIVLCRGVRILSWGYAVPGRAGTLPDTPWPLGAELARR